MALNSFITRDGGEMGRAQVVQAEAAGTDGIDGMGLLDMDTLFHGEKVQTQVRGTFAGITGCLEGLNGLNYEGYEIHMGRSRADHAQVVSANEHIYGSYIHGIFDAPGISETVLKAICERKGISYNFLGTFDIHAYKESQYDRLADAIRENLDMEMIYQIL